jgi:hypothetical protein
VRRRWLTAEEVEDLEQDFYQDDDEDPEEGGSEGRSIMRRMLGMERCDCT